MIVYSFLSSCSAASTLPVEMGSSPDVGSSIATVNDKTYPIARDLYMYTDGEPTGIVKDYLDWILAAEAQEIVAELGFVPASLPESDT